MNENLRVLRRQKKTNRSSCKFGAERSSDRSEEFGARMCPAENTERAQLRSDFTTAATVCRAIFRSVGRQSPVPGKHNAAVHSRRRSLCTPGEVENMIGMDYRVSIGLCLFGAFAFLQPGMHPASFRTAKNSSTRFRPSLIRTKTEEEANRSVDLHSEWLRLFVRSTFPIPVAQKFKLRLNH